MMSDDTLSIVNSSYLDHTPEELATAAYERAVQLEMCLNMQQASAGETKSAVAAAAKTHPHELVTYRYPPMSKTKGNFRFRAIEGEITDSQIIAVLGKQETGKSKFLRMLARNMKSVESSNGKIPKYAYKHQKRFLKNPIAITTCVRDLLNKYIHDSCMNPNFVNYVMKPLHINLLMDKLVKDLSPGQLQSVSLCICLGQPADIYLIDIPSAFLDGPQCITTARVIKRFIRHERKAAFVVEHNFMMASYLADRIILTEGQPLIDCIASAPGPVLAGAERYLSQLDIHVLLLSYKEVTSVWKSESTEVRDQKAAGSSWRLLPW